MGISEKLRSILVLLLVSVLVIVAGCSSDGHETLTPESVSEAMPVQTPIASSARMPETASWTGDPTVKTLYGTVQGFEDEANTWVFKAIPYARPPVGELRWKAPQDPDPWDSIRAETDFCSQCPQYDPFYGSVTGSEDCLYLNVWRPRTDQANLPIYVWIHGGGNSSGSATLMPGYYGANLAHKSNVVFVSMNYRIGPLGWFTHPAIRNGNPLDDSGNYGALDIIKSLEWIQNNIEAFGGDPNNVTIAGESAGGYNVLSLLISPVAKDLFHKAISQSGGQRTSLVQTGEESAREAILNLLASDGMAADRAAAGNVLGNMSATEVESYLRSKTPEELLESHPKGTFGMLAFPYLFEDGTVIPDGGFETLETGEYPNKVPIIIGSNKDELKLFLFTIPSLIEDEDLYRLVAHFGSDLWKVNGVDDVARKLSSHPDQPDVYTYQFLWGMENNDGDSVLPESWGFKLGAAHSIDIPFFFGNESGPISNFTFTEKNRAGREALTEAVMNYVSEFIRTGNPNSPQSDLPEWEPWSNEAQGPKTLLLDADLDEAHIIMSNEELTVPEIQAAMQSEVSESRYSEVIESLRVHWPAALEILARYQ